MIPGAALLARCVGEGASLQAVTPLVEERFSFKVNLPLCSGVLSRYPSVEPGGRYQHTRVPTAGSFTRAKYDEIYVSKCRNINAVFEHKKSSVTERKTSRYPKALS